jgi:murein DD-endopeptidase MepM/ murein hydrolase activator NlpD
VAINHGHGLTTIYSHMNSVGVKAGDSVVQGAVIGTIGATGRATGPHLDWRLNWFNVRLDPELVLPKKAE